jgi:acid phosphatase type 7
MKRRDFLTASVASASAGIAGGLIHTNKAEGFQETETQEDGSSFALLAPPILQWTDVDHAETIALTSGPSACHIEIKEEGSDDVRRVTNQQDGLILANETFHRIRIDQLKPGRTYEYVLVAREIFNFEPYKVTWGAELRTETYSFTTPDPDADEVRFAVLNDLHKNTDLIHQLFEAIEARTPAPEFLMLNGDILSHIENESDIRAIYDLPGSYASEHPTVWIRGNHECRGRFARYMDRYLAKPDGRYYYTFRRGPVQMLVLDCGEDKSDDHWAYSGLNDFESFRAEEEAWLETVLESDDWKNAPWRVLVVHIPVEKGTLRPGGEVEAFKRRWTEKLEAAGLDLEISAHYHRVLFTDASSEQGFPIVVGGGPNIESAVAFHVSANSVTLDVEMVDVEGTVVDRMVRRH